MDKVDYYLGRTKDNLIKSGKTLDDVIRLTNQMQSLLTAAVNMHKLAVGSIDLKLCRSCPKDSKYTYNGVNYCEEHWKIEEKQIKALEEKKAAKKNRQEEKRSGK